jgi:hypothetical protein
MWRAYDNDADLHIQDAELVRVTLESIGNDADLQIQDAELIRVSLESSSLSSWTRVNR